jgi:hypothetical protein
MKQILPFILGFLMAGSVFGQAITFNANPLVKDGTIEDFNVDAKFITTNSTTEQVDFVWELIRTDVPDEWGFIICDTRLCYSPGWETCIDAGCEINVFGPGETSSAMKVTVQPNGVKYCGIVHLRLVDANDTSKEVGNLEVQFNIECTTATQDIIEEKVNIYPNPTADFFKIESTNNYSQVVIYNIVGKEMKSYEFSNNKSYDVRDLQSGLYLVGLLDDAGQSQKVMRLTKK